MKIYPEIKKIAGDNTARHRLVEILEEKLDLDGLDFAHAYLVDGCSERKGKLYKDGKRLDNGCPAGRYDDYYCEQHCGFCEDDYYGTVYFKTNVPGQFVAVPFEC